jgi:hypothetical protein
MEVVVEEDQTGARSMGGGNDNPSKHLVGEVSIGMITICWMYVQRGK